MKKSKYLLFIFCSFFISIYSVNADVCGDIDISRYPNFPPVGEVRENRCVEWKDQPPPVRVETGYNYSSGYDAIQACISQRTAQVDKEMVTVTTGPCSLSDAQATCHWKYPMIRVPYKCGKDSASDCRTDLGCKVVQTSPGSPGYCATHGGSSSTCSGKSYDSCNGQCYWQAGSDPTYECQGGIVDAYWCPTMYKGDGVYHAEQGTCTGESQFTTFGTALTGAGKDAELATYSFDTAGDAAKAKGYCEDGSGDVCPQAPRLVAENCDMKYQGYYFYTPRVCVKYSNLNPISSLTAETYGAGAVGAYCLHAERLRPYKSTWEWNFDATQCKTSMQSKECGYANILIEGAYRQWDSNYGTIDMALRLWAADSKLGTDGTYFRVGLPTSEANPDVSFAEGSKNVYTTTISNINKYLAPGKTLGTVASVADLRAVDCRSLAGGPEFASTPGGLDSSGNGIMCGGNTEYLKSIYLYINTLQDNRYMEDHLDEVLKSKGINTVRPYKPSSYKVTKVYDPEVLEDKLEITYIMNKQVEVECDIDDPDTKLYCKARQELTFYVNGKAVTLNSDEAGTDLEYYDYCKKNRCYKTVRYTKICNEQTMGQKRTLKIRVVTEKSAAEMAVKPLFACGNQSEYQVMYSFDPFLTIHNRPESEEQTHSYTMPPNVTFTCDCDPTTYYNRDGYTTASNAQSYGKATYESPDRELKVYTKLTTELSQNNTCSIIGEDGKVTKTTKKTGEKGTYGLGPYDTFDRASVNDISMTKVLNMCYDGDKLQFDYSKDFGVNTDVCRVYCRDETNYFLSNKTVAKAGMTFSYDMAKRLDGSDLYQIIEKQKYNPTTRKATSIYTLGNAQRFNNKLTSDKKFTTIVVAERECVSEIYYNKENEYGKKWNQLTRRGEANYEQLLYDLQNCNFYSMSNSQDAPHYAIEENNRKYSTIDYIRELYNCTGETQCRCSGNSKEGLCGTMNFYYEEASNLNLNNPTMKSDMISEVSEVTYCSGDCYKIVQESGNIYTDKTENHGGNKTSGGIPTNDYASFKIITEIGFYNSNQYYSRPLVGLVTETRPDDKKNVYSKLPEYSFPTYHQTLNGTYDINNSYTMTSYDRYYKKRDKYDQFVTKGLNKYTCSYDIDTDILPPDEPGKDTCFVDGLYVPKLPECPQKLGFSFKNVDAGNLFPSTLTDGNEINDWKSVYAINWDDTRGREAQSLIESRASKIFTTDDYLDYSFSLSQDQINALKRYNKSNSNYQTAIAPETCEDPELNDGVFLNCRSEFLHEIFNSKTYADTLKK